MEKGKKKREEEGYTGIYIAHESSNLSLSGVSTHSGSDRREGQIKPLK